MLGSTHGTLTTGGHRALAGGESRAPAPPGQPASAAPETDVSGRPLHPQVPDLNGLLRPRSIVVLDAWDAEGEPRTEAIRRLTTWAEHLGARLYFASPAATGLPRTGVAGTDRPAPGRRTSPTELPERPGITATEPPERPDLAVTELPGRPALTTAELPERPDLAATELPERPDLTIAELPERPDLAVLLGPAPPSLLAELAEAEVPLAVVAAADLALPRGGARSARPRLLGPGTGLDAFGVSAGPERHGGSTGRTGPGTRGIALLSRSGAQGLPVAGLREVGVRLAHWVVSGGEADLGTAELLCSLAEQPDVSVLACFLAEPREGRALLLAADRAARRGIPLVAVTAGAPGGSPRAGAVAEAALRQFGVIQVGGTDELQDTAALLAKAGPPVAEGVGVYAPSGDLGEEVRRRAEAAGLRVRALADAGAMPEGGERPLLDALLDDPGLGVVICPLPAASPAATERLARDLAEAAERTGTLLCAVWSSPDGTAAAYRDTLLGSGRVATFRTLATCLGAVGAHLAHHRFTTGYRSPFDEAPRTPSPSLRTAEALLVPGERLSEHAAKRLLRAYGIRVPREKLVTSAAAAVRAAAQVGYPVVMKASGARLAHKSERGLLRTGLTSASQVRETYRELTAQAQYEGVALDGVLVCQMVPEGAEWVVGVAQDPVFGPTVTVGHGGELREVLPELAYGVTPFGTERAHAMLRELRGHALLDGVRGRPPLDADALAEVLLRVQRLALELDGGLTGLDIDPLRVLPRGQGAVALNVRAVCG
ncbi:acetate--CoA ligase family protein [Streptomyces sp. SCSIO ZS0520]|uniref:acetate--CoA ligase family protein n=1 Tax=Streptomyces sp. SCSIO ZS0520 TaxID=2892996 RepID=UPI0021DA64FE|nr:acetate--CoA ligase family protein [Streptomyces sp. SCSIO ZS0520]